VTHRSELPSTSAAPLEATAALLTNARRVLMTGFVDVPLEAVAAAFDAAELLGAAVDAGHPESARPAGPTIARAGEVTAAWEEMRDRADLVVLWFCNPDSLHAGFISRFVATPLPSQRNRRTLAVGPASVLAASTGYAHLSLDRAAAVDAARVVQHMLLGGKPLALAGPLAVACTALHAAVAAAACVAFVTDDSADLVGLEPWSIVHLVRTISHRKPAFEIPLAAPGTAAFRSCCTWRYGAAGAIARANRAGGEFQPAEASACRLLERGEVDCVLVVGRAVTAVERAIAARGAGLVVVRIDEPTTTLVRDLESLHAAVAARLVAATGGGRP
jgi:formylmethanofuran dehydrogenase subunit B